MCSLSFAPTLVVALAAVAAPAARAQHAQKPVTALQAGALAGESVALVPLTLAVAEPALAHDSTFRALGPREQVLHWADSIIAAGFTSRAPEVTWVPPERLRRIARRNPGMVTDPDQMGQAVLRSEALKRVPDPLRSSLRNLAAFTGGRYAMVPAALSFERDSTAGIRATLSLALADARTGAVIWRSLAWGRGPTPDIALASALAAVLPVAGVGP